MILLDDKKKYDYILIMASKEMSLKFTVLSLHLEMKGRSVHTIMY